MPVRCAVLARCKFLALLLAVALPWPASSASKPIDVLRVASPAERLRGSERVSLDPHMELQAGDALVTGRNGRGSVRFMGSASLTLGGDGQLEIHGFTPAASARGATLRARLVAGTLRIDGRGGNPLPDLRINVADLRLRVLGAEVWAEVARGTRSVCLLSGAVELQAPDGSAERLDLPGQCLVYGQGDRRLLLTPDRDTLSRKLVQTAYADEVAPSAFAPPAARESPAPAATRPPPLASPLPQGVNASGWTLVALSLADAESAQLEAQGLAEQGLPAIVRVYDPPNKAPRVYRVCIGSFPTREAAETFAQPLRRSRGMLQLWVARY